VRHSKPLENQCLFDSMVVGFGCSLPTEQDIDRTCDQALAHFEWRSEKPTAWLTPLGAAVTSSQPSAGTGLRSVH